MGKTSEYGKSSVYILTEQRDALVDENKKLRALLEWALKNDAIDDRHLSNMMANVNDNFYKPLRELGFKLPWEED